MGERRKFKPTFLRQWRRRAELSQEELAERIGCSVPLVSMVERGERQYDQEFLEAAAKALGVTAVMLLKVNPDEKQSFEEAAVDKLRRIPEGDRAKAMAVLEALAIGYEADAGAPAPVRAKRRAKRKGG